jgi:hypothetical protein
VNVVAIALAVVMVGLFIDAVRHLALAWKVFFGWQLSMPRKQRRPASAILEKPAWSGIGDYFGLGAMDDAPPEAASVWRYHAARFMIRVALFMGLGFVVVFLPK